MRVLIYRKMRDQVIASDLSDSQWAIIAAGYFPPRETGANWEKRNW